MASDPEPDFDLKKFLREANQSGLLCWQCIDAARHSGEQEPQIFWAITVVDGMALCYGHVVTRLRREGQHD
ncbi:hypothetical protein ACBJ59_10730 [Nonomuraea sp. MTCD27]|uniref:hypothetical protein n=1 Tax=Nonomuraea sp. MTCD27 TaxID=1676747 RepID=UPI0035C103E1